MVGTKTSGRRPKTREEALAQRRDSAKGGEATRAKHAGTPTSPPAPPGPATPAPLPGYCSYDAAVLANKTTYGEARLREQVIEQELINEAKRADLEIRRGQLLTREQVEARDRGRDELIMAELARIPEEMAAAVPPEAKAEAQRRGRALVDEIRTAIAAALRGMRR